MKSAKRIIIPLIAASLCLAVAGACTKNQTAPTAAQGNSAPAASGAVGKIVMGTVTEVAGNDITLKVMQTPANIADMLSGNYSMAPRGSRDPNASPRPSGQRGNGQYGGGQGGQGQGGNGGAQVYTFNGAAPDGSGMPNFSADPNASRDPNASPGAGRQGMGQQYTGETVDVIIPVGMGITTTTIDSNGPVQTEAQLSAITANSTLIVQYAADDTTIEKVMLMGMGGGAVRMQNGQDGSNGQVMQAPDGANGGGQVFIYSGQGN